jgi:hypothetical protein
VLQLWDRGWVGRLAARRQKGKGRGRKTFCWSLAEGWRRADSARALLPASWPPHGPSAPSAREGKGGEE